MRVSVHTVFSSPLPTLVHQTPHCWELNHNGDLLPPSHKIASSLKALLSWTVDVKDIFTFFAVLQVFLFLYLNAFSILCFSSAVSLTQKIFYLYSSFSCQWDGTICIPPWATSPCSNRDLISLRPLFASLSQTARWPSSFSQVLHHHRLIPWETPLRINRWGTAREWRSQAFHHTSISHGFG